MKPDPDYPRMMFHRTLAPVTVYTRDEEQLLGGEWSRTIGGSPPREKKPVHIDPFTEEPEEEIEPEDEPELPPEPKPEKHRPAPPPQSQAKLPAKPGRPPAHKGQAKPLPHKRKA